jgi:hypothetical protein
MYSVLKKVPEYRYPLYFPHALCVLLHGSAEGAFRTDALNSIVMGIDKITLDQHDE